MKEDKFDDPDQLMLAQADAGLVLVDPVSGRIEGLNPAWPQWLGRATASLQGTVFWDEGGWRQPEVVRSLVSLTSLPLAMPPMAVTALNEDRESLSLVISARSVNLSGQRLVLCTLVRSSSAQALAMSSSVAETALMGVVQALITVLEVHDPDSIGHQRRVADLAGTLARKLQWRPDEVEAVILAALIHDLGMVTVPSRILGKTEMLSQAEVKQIQKHVMTALDMLNHIEFAGPVKAYIAQHHERIDGSGYPLGLKGADVLRGSQVIGMSDMLDAMTRDRPYQSAQTMDQALQVLLVSSGIQFDADLVQACVALFVQEGYRFPGV
ncbi:HD-GYP domain-containing protein [Limnohabitans sp. 2KL-27]|uniref:HD-GYP domain-containing protein n=1 Tax=Limnohabitans sp. 2KL-27 TaxID=1100705 RepID=UPI000A5A1FB3|nr:HD domain-containing phosphohydrolase [Limnohabitans sp. 2KL-27]